MGAICTIKPGWQNSQTGQTARIKNTNALLTQMEDPSRCEAWTCRGVWGRRRVNKIFAAINLSRRRVRSPTELLQHGTVSYRPPGVYERMWEAVEVTRRAATARTRSTATGTMSCRRTAATPEWSNDHTRPITRTKRDEIPDGE